MADDDELGRFREAMDDCNRRLAILLHERAELARTIGAWKRQRRMVLADPAREDAMLTTMTTMAAARGFAPEALRRIFAVVFAESRAIVERG